MVADMEPFSIVEETRPGLHRLVDDVVRLTAAKTADHDVQYVVALREANPGTIVTTIPTYNVDLRTFAAAGYASCEVDTKTDSYISLRGYAAASNRSQQGGLAEAVEFAKYHYKWDNEDFIMYSVNGLTQYVLKECREGEQPLGPSRLTDSLIKAVGDWMTSIVDVVWVYDNYWRTDRNLYKQVMKSSWDNVILDEGMKKELTSVANKFFDSKAVYEDLGVPWKRGVMFYGPPGNGKTISIRALMHELYTRKDKDGNPDPIPTLYVKAAPTTWDIGAVFSRARQQSPCMLILEDVETIVTSQTRSYFFNELDGLENNDGLFVVGSTNFLEKLDPGLTKRPSRFDRKYKFPLPNEHERTLYAEFWRRKLKSNKAIDFPKKLCPAMAKITPGFSFAFLQECFVATLLVLAREGDEALVTKPYDDNNDDLDDYRLWLVFKQEADTLRKEIDSQAKEETQMAGWIRNDPEQSFKAMTGSADAATGQHCGQCHCSTAQQRQMPLRPRPQAHKDKVLLELPYFAQKHEFINSAAFERRMYG